MRLLRPFLVCCAACVGVAFADPVITEFMASNQNSIEDEDNDNSDWIEIHNPDATAVDLTNWSLTDNASNLRKWIFPAVSIPAGGYVIVWASSKNRRTPGYPLHTNFSLSADGEYLGLIKPDGTTKTTEFAPKFPAQVGDVSYGISGTVGGATLLSSGSAVKAIVPASNGLGTTWRNLVFDDSAWLTGTLNVGFFNAGANPNLSDQLGLNLSTPMAGNGKSAYIRVAFTVDDPADVQTLKLKMYWDDNFDAYINGVAVAASALPNPLNYNSNSNGTHSATAAQEYDLTSVIPQLVAGTNVLAIQGLNATSSSDFFIRPELTATIDFGVSETGYFNTATPAAANGGVDTIQLPQVVTFSRPSGPFDSSFSLVMTGAIAGQQIRYIIADPTATPAAAIGEPNGSSTLYTGPVTVSSTKLIRAAVYNPVNGQRGTPTTAQYLQLETAAGSTNTSNFTSQLPIVVIDDHGDGQAVDSSTLTYTTAQLFLFDRNPGGTAALNSTPTLFNRAGFRVRGRTSASFPKKGYGLETWDEKGNDLKMSILGLASESDWIFNGPWKYDDVYFHNAFIFQVSREIGRWAPRTRLVEMFLSTNGNVAGQSKLDYTDYAGVYQFMEKIESGGNRLDIDGLGIEDITGDALTGGYIFKIDDLDSDEVGWTTSRGHKPVIVEPDSDEDRPEQIAYIQDYMQAFETTVYDERTANFATRNYRKYIDVGSWIDHSLLNALAYNVDAFHLSAYFHKPRNGKIHAGPIWDFDRALNSDDGRDANPRSWNALDMAFAWWGQLLRDPDYVQALVDRWWELRRGVFSDTNLNALIDQFGNEVGAAAGARDAAKWPGNPDGNNPESGSYLGEVAALKTWMTSTDSGSLGRTNWIDTQFPGPPATVIDSAVVAPGTNVPLTGTGTIRYTTDNTDPRPAGGSATSPAPTYSSPVTINQTTVLRARRTGTFAPHPNATNIGWSAPLQRVYLVNEAFAVAGDVVVSEINYDPAPPTDAEKAAVLEVAAADFEFIELKNTGNRTVNTFELKFADTQPVKEVRLAPLTLAPGETALVVRNREAFLQRYGGIYNSKIVGEWVDGSLNNGGERIVLRARDGSLIQDFTFADLASGGRSVNYLGGGWKSDVPSPGAVGPSYGQWKSFHYPTGGVNSGDTIDADLDDADNKLEYGRGTDPNVGEDQTAFEPVFAPDGGAGFTFTYKRPINRPSASHQVQASTNLVDWTNVSDASVSTTLDLETRVANISIGAEGNRFFRLRTNVAP